MLFRSSALSFAGFVNGVSRLHGEVTKSLLQGHWPRLLPSEAPVTSITNGVHLPTWVHPDLRALLGVEGRAVRGADFARAGGAVEEQGLWELRCANKERMLAVLRAEVSAAFVARSDSAKVLSRMLDGLDPNALWIGRASCRERV